MGKLKKDPVRSRGASVMPEPETEERMKELAGGMNGGVMGRTGVMSRTKVDVTRK
jgi:hypothetical protein